MREGKGLIFWRENPSAGRDEKGLACFGWLDVQLADLDLTPFKTFQGFGLYVRLEGKRGGRGGGRERREEERGKRKRGGRGREGQERR